VEEGLKLLANMHPCIIFEIVDEFFTNEAPIVLVNFYTLLFTTVNSSVGKEVRELTDLTVDHKLEQGW